MASTRYFLLGLVLSLACLGCGPTIESGAVVTGKVVKGGKPIEVANRQSNVGKLKVELIPILSGPDDKRDRDTTGADEQGAFKIIYAGKGLKPGKYKLSVEALDEPSKDSLGGAFSESKTTIEIEIPANKVNGTFDLGTIDLDDAKYKPKE